MAYSLQSDGLHDGADPIRTWAESGNLALSTSPLIPANTWTTIASMPSVSGYRGAMAISVFWSGATSGGTVYWETTVSFIYGVIQNNAYNSAPSQVVSFNATYHHLVVAAPQFAIDSNDNAGAYGDFSLKILVPNNIQFNDLEIKRRPLIMVGS